TIRQIAVNSVGTLGQDAKPAVPALLPLLKDPAVSEAAIEALTRIGQLGKAEAPALGDGLTSSDKKVRLFVLVTLSKMGYEAKATVPAIAKTANDPDPDVRAESLNLLEKFGPEAKDATPVLVEALKDKNPASRLRAAEVLTAIGGFRASPAVRP